MAQLYRKSALERISSPEQLDKALTVTSPMSWAALAAVTVMIVVTIIWSIVGTIPVTVTTSGIIASPVSTNAIYCPETGTVLSVLVSPNTQISINDPVASYKTDNTHKRHDLKNILRPVSVGTMGNHVVVLASAVNDTAYVALLDENLNVVARRDFRSPMYAIHIEPGMLFIVGRNPYGYDINIIPLHGGLEAFANGEILTHHYRVAKQSEKIKMSDPVGIGLTAVAVAVVFLALVCISLIISGSGKLMAGMDDKKKKGDKKKGGAAIAAAASAADKEGEIYAAIATAIHLYNNELHDEENAVLTIQKVEREWTPWNAKFYNMNQYFNKVRR